MSKTNNQTKGQMTETIKDLIKHSRPKSAGDFKHLLKESDVMISRNISKSIKSFVEHSLENDIEVHLKKIGIANKETWKIDAHNVSKVFLETNKLSCVQDNVNNILDSCVREIKHTNINGLNDFEQEISPLLQPEHLIEVAECMASGKPLDVRLNALQVLLRSHFTEAVNSEAWFVLQKQLVECLCDNNSEIFSLSLKAHVKLASCSSPVAIKECALNLQESLGRHFFMMFENIKPVHFQGVYNHRMTALTQLLLDAFSEATSNVARFGESRLSEIIENFIQLLSIHVPSKQSKKQPCMSPLEMVSCVDPTGNWLLSITHFYLTRQLLLTSLSKNLKFLKLSVEEILGWLACPLLPSETASKLLSGEIYNPTCKIAIFCHSLAVFSTVCSFSLGINLFPIKLSNKDELVTADDVFKILVTSVNDLSICEVLQRAPETFSVFVVNHIAHLICVKGLNGSLALNMLFSERSLNPIKMSILIKVASIKSYSNPLLNNEISLKKKIVLFLQHYTSSCNCTSSHSLSERSSNKQDDNSQGGKPANEVDFKVLSTLELYLQYIVEILKIIENTKLPLLQAIEQTYGGFETLAGLNGLLKSEIIQSVSNIYKTLQKDFQNSEDDMNVYNCCIRILLQNASSSLGFFMLEENGVISLLLQDCLQQPMINWNDSIWMSFFSNSSTTNECFDVLSFESNGILKDVLFRLWDVIEEDCSGSDLPIEEATKTVLKIITVASVSLKGIQALLNERREGSDVTLTDENDLRPSNLIMLIQHFGLNFINCPDFIHHQIALQVLLIIVSNIQSSIYLQHKFNYQDALLQMQSDNRVDDHSEVIIDECSVLRQRIIECHFFPGRLKTISKPSHVAPRPESKLSQAKSRHRGSGELSRWLSETRSGLHDQNWLKHTRKLFRNSSLDDMKPMIIQDILDQVIKVIPVKKTTIDWTNINDEDELLPEEHLAIQTVIRYGTHLRLIQASQQNIDNLTLLILLVKKAFNIKRSGTFQGFDWFVGTIYLICSGNVEKTQTFLSSVCNLPTAPMLWRRYGASHTLAQMGHVLEIILAEELPAEWRVLQEAGLSWWQLCLSWADQSWWNVMEWPMICYWLALCILNPPDHMIYFFAALLLVNHDRLIQMGLENLLCDLIVTPLEKPQLNELRHFMDKLQKKYHPMLHSQFGFI